MLTARVPAVAGLFYPNDALTLNQEVQYLLAQAKYHDVNPKALIVPHAGYAYSGPIAATAYACLGVAAAKIRRVVLLGPAHRVAFSGLALPGTDLFDTPLGSVKLDADLVRAVVHLPQISENRAAHLFEHSLEVQLPFLQNTLGEFTLLPLVVGSTAPESVAEVLEYVWGGEETLIVISSDFSHDLPYIVAQHKDTDSVESILHLQPLMHHDQACGCIPINGLIIAVRRHRLIPRLLDLRNSGDIAGLPDRVVGYAAIAFSQGGGHVANREQ
ncbi:MAG: AmmeMemoRadiSam system protein B [Nitrosomonas sp.]|nr:MAG: AmmeMemoRadiSam system protein B [Nitrosomonas sp.]